jgi:hypothetical protein
MLCDPPPANAAILPQPRHGSYFFNRVGRFQPIATGNNRPAPFSRKRSDRGKFDQVDFDAFNAENTPAQWAKKTAED